MTRGFCDVSTMLPTSPLSGWFVDGKAGGDIVPGAFAKAWSSPLSTTNAFSFAFGSLSGGSPFKVGCSGDCKISDTSCRRGKVWFCASVCIDRVFSGC